MTLNGPRLASRSGATRRLVILLHGYGADGNDLMELARQWQAWLPDTAFVAPHAPEVCAGTSMGRQWFPLTFRDPHERWRGVNHAQPILDSFIDTEAHAAGVSPRQIALVGFSQGAMMALHVALRRREAMAAVAALSGLLVLESGRGAESLKPAVTAKPPIFLAHGAADDVIPVDALFGSVDALAQAEIPAQWHLGLRLGHGIDGDILRQAGLFLVQSFGLPHPKRN